MVRRGRVNYHVHRPFRQRFVIDADGVEGRIVEPEYDPIDVLLHDQRGEVQPLSFESDGIAFRSVPSAIGEPVGAEALASYEEGLVRLLTRELGATEVRVFDHTVREDDPDAVRPPARNVHGDYSAEGAAHRLVGLLGVEEAARWSDEHFAFVNVWRPLDRPVNSAPLAFVRPSSVAAADWVRIDLTYPDRTGHILGLVASPRHEWIYRSRMSPDEVVLFRTFDSRGLPSVAHSAVDLVEDPTIRTVRRSLESRAVVRLAQPESLELP